MGPPIWISGLFFNFVMYLEVVIIRVLIFLANYHQNFPSHHIIEQQKKLEKNGLFAIKLTHHSQRCQIVGLTLAAFVQTSIP
jgi:hypothetical protein